MYLLLKKNEFWHKDSPLSMHPDTIRYYRYKKVSFFKKDLLNTIVIGREFLSKIKNIFLKRFVK